MNNNSNTNINKNTHNNGINDTNDNNIRHNNPKRLSLINAVKSIISIRNTYKRKSNNSNSINNKNNNNINQSQVKKIKHEINTNDTYNTSLVNADNVLIPVILCNCLSYLELKELNLIITRVNKYWKNHTYNNITLGYREVELSNKQYELLSQYYNSNNTGSNNDKAVNLLNQLKYSSNICFELLTSVEVFLNIIKQARYLTSLTIEFTDGVNYFAITDEALNNVRLDKLESLRIGAYGRLVAGVGQNCDYLLRRLMKCVDLDKITNICLIDVPIHSEPLQIFENNPFINLTNLNLTLDVQDVSNDSLNYLCDIVRLVRLHLHFSCYFDPYAFIENWHWLIKLINLEQVCVSTDKVVASLLAINCVKALTNLAKLRELMIFADILLHSNECQLFSQLKLLTSLCLSQCPIKKYDLNLTTFPTIPSLTHLAIEFCNPAYMIPILKSNPQINSIKFGYCTLYADIMVDILEVASTSLQSVCSCNTDVDYVMECSASYPYPLLSNVENTVIDSNTCKQLITRLKQHLQPGYKCLNSTCFSRTKRFI